MHYFLLWSSLSMLKNQDTYMHSQELHTYHNLLLYCIFPGFGVFFRLFCTVVYLLHVFQVLVDLIFCCFALRSSNVVFVLSGLIL